VTPPPCGISPATFLRVRPPAQWNVAPTRTAGGTAGFTRECDGVAGCAAACGAATRGADPRGAGVRSPVAVAVAETLPSSEVSTDTVASDPPPAIVSVPGGEETAGAASAGSVGVATGRSDR
jgi:hypothetical protein